MKTKFAARQRLADAAEEATGEEQVEKEASKLPGEWTWSCDTRSGSRRLSKDTTQNACGSKTSK